MNEDQATRLASIIGGRPWNSGDDVWVVRKERGDGKLIEISDEAVCEYESQEMLEAGEPDDFIPLC